MNHINNITNLENQMVDLLSLALKQPLLLDNYINHPIRIIEASKSLIGLNLDEPSKSLINFLNSLKLEKVSLNESKAQVEKYETVSIYQLEDAINNSDTDRINKILDNILNLSDGKHILEFLVELSLRQKGKSLQVIWSIYKTMNFIGYNDRDSIRNSIDIACKLLRLDDFHDTYKKKNISIDQLGMYSIETAEQLYVMGIAYEISNISFIRQGFIEKNLSSFLNYYYSGLDKINSDPCHTKSNDLENHVDLLEKLNSFTLSGEVILAFNSIRSIMKQSKSAQKRSAIYHINNIKRLIGG